MIESIGKMEPTGRDQPIDSTIGWERNKIDSTAGHGNLKVQKD